ncbi:hypothetical protein HPB52_010494 [Rhipicephalus sanguineus]|uniref:Ig-like domain-containing protein n=1 Tax=Rhipicephalus sanguineus TaxID=34632 RepID=A0A9D4PME3_RHISA|nr:hypothetical protein HPB52_010494 [Rhipicephalus sanguineus]
MLCLNRKMPPSITPFSFPRSLSLALEPASRAACPRETHPYGCHGCEDGIATGSDSSSTSAVGIASGHVDDFISTLVFRSLREEHTAVYTCLAANEAASINYSAPLVVYAPPRWRLEPTDTTVTTGERIILDCQADGTPEPRVRWKKSAGLQATEFRTVISSSRMQALVNGSLVIQEVETLDAGGYMCEASNGVGLPLYTVVQVNDTRQNAEAAKAALDFMPMQQKPLRVRFATHGAALKVKNFSQWVTNELLELAFSVFGEVERAVVIVDDRGRSVGEGIVEFSRKQAAQQALKRCSEECFILTRSVVLVVPLIWT